MNVIHWPGESVGRRPGRSACGKRASWEAERWKSWRVGRGRSSLGVDAERRESAAVGGRAVLLSWTLP